MDCGKCGTELVKSDTWPYDGKTFQRNVCPSCKFKGKAFLVSGGSSPKSPQTKKDMDAVWADKDLKMARMCGIKAAVRFACTFPREGKTPDKEDVVMIADYFLKYITTGRLPE